MEHHIFFDEPYSIELEPPVNPSGATRACVVNGIGLQLRRMDDKENRFIPGGTYRESWAVLPNYQALGMEDIYGFNTWAELSGECLSDEYGGSLGYQLSYDGGLTWYYHNGIRWVLAGAENWNTEAQVDKYIPQFPLPSKQIRLKVRLIPGKYGKTTPLLKRVTFFVGLRYELQDDLYRSVKHWLEKYCWYPTKVFGNLVDSDVLLVEKQWDELGGPASVYNLTYDPYKMHNLFLGFIPGGIKLISKQTGFIEANIFARPAVYIGAEEFMEIAKIPSIVVNMVNAKERRDMRHLAGCDREVDKNLGSMMARIHEARTYFDVQFRISCQSDLKHEAVQMSEAVNKAVTYRRFILSEQSGERMPVVSATPIMPANRVAQGLFVHDFQMTLAAKTWLRPDQTFEEFLVKDIVIWTRGMGKTVVSPELTEVSYG